MPYICTYNFITKKSQVVTILSKTEAERYLQEVLQSYIIEKQGKDCMPPPDKLDELYMEPWLGRSFGQRRFYIKKSLNNPNKFTIIEKKKVYGYLYNGFEYTKHMTAHIYTNFILKNHSEVSYPKKDVYYDDVVNELKDKLKENFTN